MSKPCKERISQELKDRISDLKKLWNMYKRNPEAYDDELGNFYEYGLCFDYVPQDTFNDQEQGYFRYQLSWGGPSDEFRFFTGPELRPYRIEYWFLDWFDGACKVLGGKDFDLLNEIFEDLRDCGTVEHEFNKAIGG